MVDNSELDYLVTFLAAVTTGVSVGQIEVVTNANLLTGAKTIYLYPGEHIAFGNFYYQKRFNASIVADTEANLTAIINEIIEGLDLLNTRQTIGTYTRETTLIHGIISTATKGYFQRESGGSWSCNIFLDITWSTS